MVETGNSLIIPVYRNADTADALVTALQQLAIRLGGDLEVVLVVDGSPDDSLGLLGDLLGKAGLRAQLLAHSRNFGSFAAIRTGLAAARGKRFAVMAADLQEPPELVLSFFEALKGGEADLVCGTRRDRDDPSGSKLAAQTFWRLYRLLVQPEVPAGGVDMFGCNLAVRDALLAMEESHSSLIGQLFWLGFRRKEIPYERRARAGNGVSGWTFRKKWKYMLDSVFSFTDLPMRLLSAVGFWGIGLSILVSAGVGIGWLAGWISVLGYTPIMLMLAFSTSVNLLAVGILGSYVWRTFENTKRRPLSVLMSRREFHPESV
jgi:glycosyltransferase involved in cell wall biosynthesis